jgi:acyl carrier protein
LTIEETITQKIREEFGENAPDVEIHPDTQLVDEAVVDSLGVFMLIAFLEEEFALELEPDEVTFENFATVRTIADLVRAKQASAA